jgi:hypothetical protein
VENDLARLEFHKNLKNNIKTSKKKKKKKKHFPAVANKEITQSGRS